MKSKKEDCKPIEVPAEAAVMSPKQILQLMRALGVGKENYPPPRQARSWTTTEFLDACARDDVIRRAKKFPPERTTVDAWFSPNGPLPDDRRDAWHYFFHVFFSYERRAFGTLEWKAAYFDAVKRAKIKAVSAQAGGPRATLPLEPAQSEVFANLLTLQKGQS